MLVNLENYNKEINGKIDLKIKIPKKALSDGPSAILRLLKNINMAKVYILKWYQNLIFVDRGAFSDITKMVENICLACNSTLRVRPKMAISFSTMEYWIQTLQYFLGARGIFHSTPWD